MKSYFITGTDTDCGKTYATCELLNHLQARHFKAEPLKPVASGCVEKAGKLLSEDALRLKEHSSFALDEINPWRFARPVSPHIAAHADGKTLSATKIADYCLDERFNHLDYLLIEGAGGLLVPLNKKETWIDMLQISQLPVILVVGIKLGCINHALLSQAAMTLHQIRCAGWIANYNTPETLMVEDVVNTLENSLHFPKLAQIPYNARLIDINLSIL